MMDLPLNNRKNFLTLEELEIINSAKLSLFEKHHIRLLAHCLESFRAMVNGTKSGSLPDENLRLEWLNSQPSLKDQEEFISILLDQFALAGKQLEDLASRYQKSPLGLTVADLVQSRLDPL